MESKKTSKGLAPFGSRTTQCSPPGASRRWFSTWLGGSGADRRDESKTTKRRAGHGRTKWRPKSNPNPGGSLGIESALVPFLEHVGIYQGPRRRVTWASGRGSNFGPREGVCVVWQEMMPCPHVEPMARRNPPVHTQSPAVRGSHLHETRFFRADVDPMSSGFTPHELPAPAG